MDEQAHLNAEVWEHGDFVGVYATRELRPAEAILLERYRGPLSGRVLELGCGAGRLTGHLAELASELHAIDISPAMIDYCRRAYPRVAFAVGDLRDLSRFGGCFDAVLAPFNVIDVLGDGERRRVLREIHRLLAEDGVLIASSHNLASAPAIARPTRVEGASMRELARSVRRIPLRVRNYRRLAGRQRRERDYAVLVDEAHDFSLLHYYISRDAQQRQFAQEGFELVECLRLSGEPAAAGDEAASASELYYVARPARAQTP
jgi:SAM-dependent methyltransferase